MRLRNARLLQLRCVHPARVARARTAMQSGSASRIARRSGELAQNLASKSASMYCQLTCTGRLLCVQWTAGGVHGLSGSGVSDTNMQMQNTLSVALRSA